MIGLSAYSPVTLIGVPVFFSVSGLVLAYNYRKRKFSIKRFYKRRVFYIGIPYLIWAAVFLITFVGRERPFRDLPHVFLTYLYQTATGTWLTLWFIYVLFQFYMLFPLLIKLYDLMSPIQHKLLVMGTLILGLCMYGLQWGFDVYANNIEPILGVPLWNFFGPWVFYYVFGMSVGYHWESVRLNLRRFTMFKPLICTLYVIAILVVPFFQKEIGGEGCFTPTMFLLSLLTILFFLIMFSGRTEDHRDHGILKLLKVFGVFSFGIYLVHRPVTKIFGFVIVTLTLYQGSLMPILYLAFVPIICMCLVSLLWRVPWGEFIIGRRPWNKAHVK